MPKGDRWGWLVVAVLGPPICFAYGQRGDWQGFLWAWIMVALCAAGLALEGRPGTDGRPRCRLRGR